MAGITITLDDSQFSRWLHTALRSLNNPADALMEIGEVLTQSTQNRFGTKKTPDGSGWAPNSPVTIAIKGHGSQLRGKSKALGDTIHYQMDGAQAVQVGSNMVYAAVQQFGQPKGASGRTRRGAPIPWGDIPPRPFVGVSQEDEARIMEIMTDYLRHGF